MFSNSIANWVHQYNNGGSSASGPAAFFNYVNTTYPNRLKYVCIPLSNNAADNTLYWVVMEEGTTRYSTAKTIAVGDDTGFLAASNITVSTQYDYYPFGYHGDKLFTILKGSNVGTDVHLTMYQYDSSTGTIISPPSGSSVSSVVMNNKYPNTRCNGSYVYNGTLYIVMNGLLKSTQTLQTYVYPSSSLSLMEMHLRRDLFFLSCDSSGNRKYLIGWNGSGTNNQAMNYGIYQTTDLTGVNESNSTVVASNQIPYGPGYATYWLYQNHFASGGNLILRTTDHNVGTNAYKIDFNSDFTSASIGQKYVTVPSDKSTALFNFSAYVLFESPYKMWYLDTSNNIVSADIDLS